MSSLLLVGLGIYIGLVICSLFLYYMFEKPENKLNYIVWTIIPYALIFIALLIYEDFIEPIKEKMIAGLVKKRRNI